MKRAKAKILNKAFNRALDAIRSPAHIQDVLDSFSYRITGGYYSALIAFREKQSNCFNGALFAACSLERLGFPPMIMDLRAHDDDDHVIAVFRSKSGYGAIAKSNFSGLRYREPVYRTLRELALSYFNDYFNSKRQRTLREYSNLLPLTFFDYLNWRESENDLYEIALKLDSIKHWSLLKGNAGGLSKVDLRLFQSGMLGVNKKGLY